MSTADISYPKLPLFLTSVATDSDHNAFYHETEIQALNIISDVSSILQKFAVFIAAVAETNDFVFAAHVGYDKSFGQDGGHPSIFHALTASDGNILLERGPDFSSPPHDALDFLIRISAPNVPAFWERELCCKAALVLDVFEEVDCPLKLRLRLRKDHGPPIAALHLLRLAALYLSQESSSRSYVQSSIINLQNTELSVVYSRVNFPPHKGDPRLLHSAFEQVALEAPDAIAVDYIPSSSKINGSLARERLSFRELNEKASLLAAELSILFRDLNWKPVRGVQKAVPVFLPPSPELCICTLAILKTGHAVCPLPLDAPIDRLRTILRDIEAPAVIGLGSNPWEEESQMQTTWFDLANMQRWHVGHHSPDPVAILAPKYHIPSSTELAYVMYTSGSTGVPKGVLMTHFSYVNVLKALQESLPHLPTGQAFRWFQLTAPSFDIAGIDIFFPLSVGGTICTAERGLLLTDVEAAIHELQAIATFAVTSLAMLFRPDRIPSLKTVVTGGEVLQQRLIENFAAENSPERDRFLLNVYGPTESGIVATTERVIPHTRTSIVGDPVPTAAIVILDCQSADPKEVPLGLSGELAVCGPQIEIGYLNQPDETARGFIMSPSLGPLYRTGDKGRVVWNSEGIPKIEFLGRLNTDQIKFNGRRLEFGEIESVMAKIPGVAEVTVVLGGAKLIACIVVWPGAQPEDTKLQCHDAAAKSLSPWMRPAHILCMEHLPRVLSGKIDRKTLSALALERVKSDELRIGDLKTDSAYESDGWDSGDVRAVIYRTLVDTMGTEVRQWNGTTSLLQVGLDSLRAMAFLQKARRNGIHELNIFDLLMGTTIDGLIDLVEKRRQSFSTIDGPTVASSLLHKAPKMNDIDVLALDGVQLLEYPLDTRLRHFDLSTRPYCVETLGISMEDVEQVLPATSLQTRVLLDAMEAKGDIDNYVGKRQVEHWPYKVPASLDFVRLQRAVDTVLKRHDCFRAVFLKVEHPLSPFAQVVLSSTSLMGTFPVVETTCNQYDESPDSLWQHTVDNLQRGAEAVMGLGRLPFVISYVRTPHHEHCLMIWSMFHPAYDGVSITYLRKEVIHEYHNPGTLPYCQRLPIRKAAELNFDTDWMEISMYWMQRFGGRPPFRLGTQCPKPVAYAALRDPGKRSATHMESTYFTSRLSLNELTTKAAANLATTPLAVVQAAWTMILANTLPQIQLPTNKNSRLDIQFGSILHGRYSEEAQLCMAFMIAIIPMVVTLKELGNPTSQCTNKEICRLLAKQHAESIPYLQVPSMAFDRAPLPFDTIVVLQTRDTPGDDDLPGFNSQENLLRPYKELDIGFPVAMEIWPGREDPMEKLILKCTVNTRNPKYSCITPEWAHCISEKMDEVLCWILENPEAPFNPLH